MGGGSQFYTMQTPIFVREVNMPCTQVSHKDSLLMPCCISFPLFLPCMPQGPTCPLVGQVGYDLHLPPDRAGRVSTYE